MVVRLRPDIGEDIVRYPDHHERHARRLIDQLRIAPEALSLMLLDDITVDIHRTIVELERRVLPELQRHLDERQRGRLLDAEFTELQ